jgi:hypothetical protein
MLDSPPSDAKLKNNHSPHTGLQGTNSGKLILFFKKVLLPCPFYVLNVDQLENEETESKGGIKMVRRKKGKSEEYAE